MQRNDRAFFLSAVTLIEIEAGILKLHREGKTKRAGEIEALRDSIAADFADRLLVVNAAVALTSARLAEAVRPFVIEWKNLLIAVTAKEHGLTVLTSNLRHFAPTRVPTLDLLAEAPPDATL